MVFFFAGLFLKMLFLMFGVTLKIKYSIDFHDRGTESLEIYSSMAGRVGHIKNFSLNNFKMIKSTKKQKFIKFMN